MPIGVLGALSAGPLWRRALLAYLPSPAASGQFWPYHWLPMQFWAMSCAGLLLVGLATGRGRVGRGLLAVAALTLLQPWRIPTPWARTPPPHSASAPP